MLLKSLTSKRVGSWWPCRVKIFDIPGQLSNIRAFARESVRQSRVKKHINIKKYPENLPSWATLKFLYAGVLFLVSKAEEAPPT